MTTYSNEAIPKLLPTTIAYQIRTNHGSSLRIVENELYTNVQRMQGLGLAQ